jgi:hypothetical protein
MGREERRKMLKKLTDKGIQKACGVNFACLKISLELELLR